jgi:subtilisin-like proprotein convertase family protein
MKKTLLPVLLMLFLASWINSSAQTTAAYSFSAFSSTYASIATTGTSVTTILADDATTPAGSPVLIGFNFNYCGTIYTQLSACSNGWVSLTNYTTSAPWTNATTSIMSAGWLMAYWDDLRGNDPSSLAPTSSAYYQTLGSAPNRVFVFEWNGFHQYSPYNASISANFQVRLYEGTNIVQFCYGTGSFSGASATIGIANSTTDWQTLSDATASPISSGSTFNTGIGGCPATNQVYQWAPCPISVTASNSSPACPGSNVTLTGVSTGTSFTWTGPGGYSSTSLVATVSSIPSSGAGTYTLVASNGTCTMSATTVVTLNPGPGPFTVTPPSATSCGAAIALSAPPITAGTATTTFTNSTAFTVPDSDPAGAISSVSVTGIPASATILDVSVVLNDVTMTFDGDLTYNIQAPNTNNLNLFNREGGSGDNFTNTVFSSLGGSAVSSGIPPFTGTFAADAASAIGPTGYVSSVTTWPPLYSIMNGTWQLAVRDWAFADIATVNSWSLVVHYTTPPGSYTWAPTTGLYLDAALTTPYTGTPTNTVYASPAATTTFTATATITGFTCTSTATSTITYSPAAGAISGPTSVCAGSTMTLSETATGGTWGSSNIGVATIDLITGVVTGVAAGTADITYTTGSGCFVLYGITVNATPSTITGTAAVCVGATTSLSNSLTGGIWTSSNGSIASVAPLTGIVSGVVAGTATITYTVGSCLRTVVVTVNANPLPITYSTATLCVGQTTTMTDGTTGGIWSATPTIVGSVGAATGVVRGNSVGTATISYRVLGCSATVVVTVVGAPAIGTSSGICYGSTGTLTAAPTGGTWSSMPGTGSAPITSAGVVTGATVGTATISYSVGTGCSATRVVTVVPVPSTPTGVLTVCPGTATTLSDSISGGTWSSSSTNATAATLTTTTGLITGSSPGTAIITYTASGCGATATVTVNPNPSSILGAYSMCAGGVSTFSDATPGGTWSSATSLITIGSSSGIATAGAVSGTNTISYTVTSTGCYTTANVTINPLPSAISGTLSVCPGLTTTLSDATPGGAWSTTSSNFTVDISGVVTGTAAGTGLVSYTDGATGCVRTAVVTVSTPPTAIGGVASVCVGFTTTLTDATTGGTWSGGAAGIATISSSGVVTGGPGTGTATITYTTGCSVTKVVTVNAGPGTISGPSSVCVGQTIALTSSSGGGSWSSSNLAVGTIGSSSGILGGVTSGTITVTNSLGSGGCSSTMIVTVTPSPAAIGGTTSICVGACTTLTDASTGGTWSISPAGVATIISGTGLMCGSAAGTATVTYATGCPTTTVITVNALPGAITGTLSVCSGSATTVADATTGGTWSSSNSAVASIGSLTGIITGGSVSVATTATITYSMPTGCVKTAIVTVNPLPTSITSTPAGMQVCIGSTIALTGAPTGGTWLSSDITIATVGSTTGVVTGIAAPTTPGTVTITYTLPTGCTLASTVTVNPLPSVVSGTLTVCPGTTTTLSDPTSGGVWSSSLPTTASVGTSTGIVMGIAPGTATIAYTLTTGCRRTAIVTVNTVPGAITPASPTVCEGQTITLSDGTTGGNWSEADGTGTATVGASTGIVTGSTAGTVTISYTLSATGCFVTKIVTVLPNPAAIGGNLSTCAGSTGTLTDGTPSGSWISSSPGVVSINPSTGVYTAGTSAGTATVTYIMGSGCYTTTIVTVTTAPTNISGSLVVCEGSTTTLVSTPTGGTWSSSNSSVFTVDATGVVTGGTAGTATVTYSLGSGCIKTATVTVNTSPAVITGTPVLCVGMTTTLSETTTGGSWSSSNTSVATVSSGVVTGVGGGTAIISYSMPTGCSRWVIVTVNTLPAAAANVSVCQGQTTTLTTATPGGAWSSSDPTVATITTPGGVVTGVTAGTVIITYSLGTGCISTSVVTVLPLPAAITGALNLCPGTVTTLADATGGGSWSSSSTAVAAIGSSTGIVTGGSVSVATTATITYTLASTGCYQIATVTVNPLPAAITGSTGFCNLTTTTLSDATAGGTWSSGTPATADFPSATSGALTAANVGTVTVTYTLPTGCIATRDETIILAPYPITGTFALCEGVCTTMSNIITGGTWTSTDPTVAPISTPGGVACGISSGTTAISYELSNGCYSSVIETVNATPGAITGIPEVCVGLTTTLANALSGGSWSSTDASIAFADPITGVVTGENPGTAIISYTMAGGCYASVIVTVDPLPSPITGTLEVCVGLTSTLSNSTAGGTWSSDPSLWYIASVTPGSGVVSGITPVLRPSPIPYLQAV